MSDKGNLNKDRLALALSLRVLPIMAEKKEAREALAGVARMGGTWHSCPQSGSGER